LADETKVTAEDFLKSSFSDDPATPFFSGQFPLGEVFDLQEKIDHFFGPALIEFLVQVGEFTLEVRVAQSVQTIFKSKICAKTLIRDELVAAEVEGRGLHVRAILGGRGDSFRKGCGEHFCASLAGAFAGAVFGDIELDGRDVVDLSSFVLRPSSFVVCRLWDGAFAKVVTTARAGLVGAKVVKYDMVGMGHFSQSGAEVTFFGLRAFCRFLREGFWAWEDW
jgi:hypothetical protein